MQNETVLAAMIARPDGPDKGLTSLGETLLNPNTLARTPGPFRQALRRQQMNNGGFAQKSNAEFLQEMAEDFNKSPGDLNEKGPFFGVDCKECRNKGTVAFVGQTEWGPEIRNRECACMRKRRYLRNARESGLSELLTRYTFDAWQCREAQQRGLCDMALRYAQCPEGWFMVSGKPGTGKTHICTALCGLLLEKGLEVRYMLWREVSRQAKAVVNEREAYEQIVEPLRRVRVLYIDDFLKTGKAVDRATGQGIATPPTSGDINLALDIINARYNNAKLLTILSTELESGSIMSMDEALGSRIVERTNGRYARLTGRNWRLA